VGHGGRSEGASCVVNEFPGWDLPTYHY
jgi:hypothetical protein